MTAPVFRRRRAIRLPVAKYSNGPIPDPTSSNRCRSSCSARFMTWARRQSVCPQVPQLVNGGEFVDPPVGKLHVRRAPAVHLRSQGGVQLLVREGEQRGRIPLQGVRLHGQVEFDAAEPVRDAVADAAFWIAFALGDGAA